MLHPLRWGFLLSHSKTGYKFRIQDSPCKNQPGFGKSQGSLPKAPATVMETDDETVKLDAGATVRGFTRPCPSKRISARNWWSSCGLCCFARSAPGMLRVKYPTLRLGCRVKRGRRGGLKKSPRHHRIGSAPRALLAVCFSFDLGNYGGFPGLEKFFHFSCFRGTLKRTVEREVNME